MVSGEIEKRLENLGLSLPDPPVPVGSYCPGVVVGNLVYVSGQTARINGIRRYVGKLGVNVSLQEGYLSSRDAMLNCLSVVRELVGDLDRVRRVVKVVGYINSAPGFDRQPDVLNGASDLLIGLYGELGRHARCAVGVAELPYGASVELDLIVSLD